MGNIQLIGIVGAGQMGRGIAQVAAQTGYDVVLFDAFKNSLDFGHGFIKTQLDKGVEKGKWGREQADQAFSKIKTTVEISDLKNCDLVIEAATEKVQLKFEIFKKLDEVVKPEAILASNTSSISITEIAAQTKRADKVAGMHFMNPVPVMKLVEGIRGL